MSFLKTISSDTLIYGFGNGLKKFIGLLLFPFFTRALSAGEIGVLDILGNTTTLLGIVLAIGIDSASTRFYYAVECEKEKGIILFTALIIRLSIIIPVLICCMFSLYFSTLLFENVVYKNTILITLLILPVNGLLSEQQRVYRCFREPWKYNLIILLKAIIGLVLGIYLVLFMKKGVNGAQLSVLLSSLIVVILSFIIFTNRKYVFEFSIPWAKKMLKFGYPLMISGVGIWVLYSIDRFFILHYNGTVANGFYSVGATLSQPVELITFAFEMSFLPLILGIYEKEEAENKINTKSAILNGVKLYLIITVYLSLILSVFSKEIITILATSKYLTVGIAIPCLTFSMLIYQSSQMFSAGIYLKGKTHLYIWLTLISGLTNIGLNFYFIPRYNFLGAAIATLLSNFVIFFLTYKISQKIFHITNNFMSLYLFGFIVFTISISFPIAEVNYGYNFSFTFKLLTLLLCLFIPFMVKLIKYQELMRLLSVIKRIK